MSKEQDDNLIDPAIGSRIRKKRELWKMTQEKLSERLGITSNYLGEIERGNRPLSLSVAQKLCTNFGLTLNFLYEGIEENPASQISEESAVSVRSDAITLLQAASEEECYMCYKLIQSALEVMRGQESKDN